MSFIKVGLRLFSKCYWPILLLFPLCVYPVVIFDSENPKLSNNFFKNFLKEAPSFVPSLYVINTPWKPLNQASGSSFSKMFLPKKKSIFHKKDEPIRMGSSEFKKDLQIRNKNNKLEESQAEFDKILHNDTRFHQNEKTLLKNSPHNGSQNDKIRVLFKPLSTNLKRSLQIQSDSETLTGSWNKRPTCQKGSFQSPNWTKNVFKKHKNNPQVLKNYVKVMEKYSSKMTSHQFFRLGNSISWVVNGMSNLQKNKSNRKKLTRKIQNFTKTRKS